MEPTSVAQRYGFHFDLGGEGPGRSAATPKATRTSGTDSGFLMSHLAVLEKRAVLLTRNRSDAEDLLHDTVERALKRWSIRIGPAGTRAWLLIIMQNLFLDRVRSPRNRISLDADDVIEQVPYLPAEPEAPWQGLDRQAVFDVLPRLSESLRRAFLLSAAGRSYDAIGRALDIPRSTVGTRIYRARQQIRRHLESRLTKVQPEPDPW